MKIGDKVSFYNYTTERTEYGTITDIDVPVMWIWEWKENGKTYQSKHPHKCSYHPNGVMIDNSLSRTYAQIAAIT